nr:anti-sigma regulatory factor [Petrachloros mirabilis]
MSFPSTLYLWPITDLLLADLPKDLHPDLHIGLQEALVNAAKHGNCLDPSKTIRVQYCLTQRDCWWVITDEGNGFAPPLTCPTRVSFLDKPDDSCECGRGLYILHQVFDHVRWNDAGTELTLGKQLRKSIRPLLLAEWQLG